MWSVEQREELFVGAVVPRLKEGIDYFNTLASILLDYEESKKQTVQQVIQNGKQSLEQSETAARSELSKVDDYSLSLTVRKGDLARQKEGKTTELNNLRSDCQCIVTTLETYRQSLAEAERHAASARNNLNGLRRKQEESEAVRNAGIGIMFIPIIGTIIGAVMVGVSQTDLDNAKWAAERAENELRNWQGQVNSYDAKLREKQWQKQQRKSDIEYCEQTLRQLEWSLQEVNQQRTNIARVQEKLRSAVNILGTLAGRASVAETQTRRIVLLAPVVNILGEIIKLTLEIAGNKKYQILSQPCVREAIQSLQEIYKKVSAIDNQQSLNELQFE
ncbi:hypothetical protein MATL_G00246280 [Megalops atlanticus]|uniref:Uncharacterized protein n=1 Tax=Megalops atlanticus TaxID=7932 RepID=A0A9D3PF39_MEGAT|nr:hypothetical protein MATL_G00246280 [Megalops atlanticus]